MTVRTIRFLSLASVGGADQTALRSAASAATCPGDSDGSDVEASCAAILVSILPTRVSALFHRNSRAGSAGRRRRTAGMPDRRCSAPPRGRAPAPGEPDRGGWPLVLRPRRPQLSLPVRQPAEELPRWRRRHAI